MASTRSASTTFSPAKVRHSVRGYLFIAAAALCWGVSASLGRAAFTGRLLGGAVRPIDPLILSQSRTTISFLLLLPLLLISRGASAVQVARQDFWKCVAVGVLGVAASNYFYYLAIQRTNVATAIILQYTAPIWVLVYMALRGRQRVTVVRAASIALALVGIVFALGRSAAFKLNLIGVTAAQLAAFSFAYYNVAAADIVPRYDRWRVLLLALLGAAVFWQFVNPPWRIVKAHYSGPQWIFMVVFAITSVLLPFSCYFGGLQYLDATRAVVTSCLEPVFSIAIAAVALGELVGPVQAVGMALVLLATVLVQMPDRFACRDLTVPLERAD